MCGLTQEDWLIIRAAIEDRHEPHRAAVLGGMIAHHETDVEMMARMRRWSEAGDLPQRTVADCMEYEVCGYSQHLIHPRLRKNRAVEVRCYQASNRMWAYSEQGYEGLYD